MSEQTYEALESELRYCKQRVVLLEAQLKEVMGSGWSESRALKLRRLETMFSQVAAVIRSDHLSPVAVTTQLRTLWDTEFKYIVPAPIPPPEQLSLLDSKT